MNKKWVVHVALSFAGLGLGGCAAAGNDAPTDTATSPAGSSIEPGSVDDADDDENSGTLPAVGSPAPSTEPIGLDDAGDETEGENIATVMDALTDPQRVALCQAAAGVGAALGCAGVTASCAATDVFTAGSVTIPCVLLVAFACAAHTGGSAIIMSYCPEYATR